MAFAPSAPRPGLGALGLAQELPLRGHPQLEVCYFDPLSHDDEVRAGRSRAGEKHHRLVLRKFEKATVTSENTELGLFYSRDDCGSWPANDFPARVALNSGKANGQVRLTLSEAVPDGADRGMLENTLRTKWPAAAIDWHGRDPIL